METSPTNTPRTKRGSKISQHVAEIVAAYKLGESSSSLGKKHGVSVGCILGVLRANNVTVRGKGRPKKTA